MRQGDEILMSSFQKNPEIINDKKEKKKSGVSKLAGTFFRNGLRSNLDLTSLADSKAGILISINGFILTVAVTASSFIIHSSMMTYAFIAIILTALGSIILAVLAVKPRHKQEFMKKEHIGASASLLYYQDMARMDPDNYLKYIKKVLKSDRRSIDEMGKHLLILGKEIEKKYFWLKWAYAYFALGLFISVLLIINALMFVEKNAFFPSVYHDILYKKGTFYNIFEPSGATTLPDGNVLLAEDEGGHKAFKLVKIATNGKVNELGHLYMPKHIRKVFKKVEDVEGLASYGSDVFAVTSFAPDRSGKQRSERRKLIRFRYDSGSVGHVDIYKGLLKTLERRFPEIFGHSPLFTSDVNIEGLLFDPKRKMLYLGFRSPLYKKKAVLIGIKNYQDLFDKKSDPIFDTPILLEMDGAGIRGICYNKKRDGYWIIAGSSRKREGDFTLWFYDKQKKRLRKIPDLPNLGYAEGITLVPRNADRSMLFIVDDNGKKPNKPATYIMLDEANLL